MGRSPDYNFSMEELQALWESDLSINAISKKHPVSERRIRRLFVGLYGEEAVVRRQEAHVARKAQHFAKPIPRAQLEHAFYGDLPIKALVRELGRKSNVLKALFIEHFGEAAYQERGERIAALRLERNAVRRLAVRYRNARGYWEIPRPAWFKAASAYVPEHRVVYAQTHGLTSIPTDMHVHHVDGDKGNNDPSNLQLLAAGDHRRLHLAEQGAPTQRDERGQYTART